MTRIAKLSQPESVADVGAAHAHLSVVRKTNKKGKP